MITINSVGKLFLGANRFQIDRLGPKDFKSQDLGKIVRERYLIYRLGMGYVSTCYLYRDLPYHRMLMHTELIINSLYNIVILLLMLSGNKGYNYLYVCAPEPKTHRPA